MHAYEIAAEELRKNKGQWAAYETRGNAVILAGPGSGKTKALTIKMARVLAEDVRAPRGIACVTYNNECARELQRRLTRLGVTSSARTFVGTLHGFCLRHILGPFGALAGGPLNRSMASTKDRRRILAAALERFDIKQAPSDWEGLLSVYRLKTLDRDSDPGWTPGDRAMTDVCIAYEKGLERENLIDFDGTIIESLWLVERHEWAQRALKAKFPVLVVDEYQDLGLPLHRLVLKLCFGAGVRLLAVGDPDQSIYVFRGAVPELLTELAQRQDVEPITLELNYRSGRSIVEASRGILGADRPYRAHSEDAGVIEFYKCENGVDEQVEHVATKLIPAFQAQGVALGSMAVLYPTRVEGDAIEAAARDAALPYVRVDRTAYTRSPLIMWLEDCATWASGGWRTGDPLLSQLATTWLDLQALRDGPDARAAREKLVAFLFPHRDAALKLHDWLNRAQSALLPEETVRRLRSTRDDRDALEELLNATSPGHSLADMTVGAFGGMTGSPEQLNLMTLWGAKGSEFDVVFMIGMDEGRLPNYYDARDPARLVQARRVFYVGVTRARKEVHLLCSGWTVNSKGQRYDNGPSRFLADLYNALRKASAK
jgi:DNA helicase-2/ATP-dependent DNA helicase PcrA